MQTTLFSLGTIAATPAALNIIGELGTGRVIQRHGQGDWGDVSDMNRKVNDERVKKGSGDISSTYSLNGNLIHVKTLLGQGTIVMLPEEF